jgi:hypothetical protein
MRARLAVQRHALAYLERDGVHGYQADTAARWEVAVLDSEDAVSVFDVLLAVLVVCEQEHTIHTHVIRAPHDMVVQGVSVLWSIIPLYDPVPECLLNTLVADDSQRLVSELGAVSIPAVQRARSVTTRLVHRFCV